MNSSEILKQEFIDISKSQLFNLGCSIGLQEEENFFKWRISFIAPKNSLYEGGLFFLGIIFPKDYPKNPLEINFLIPIYHINVNSNKNSNEPAIFFWPNPDFSYSKEMADEYNNNRPLL